MDKQTIRMLSDTFTSDSDFNRISAEEAIVPELAGETIFDPPLIGISAADDPLYAKMKVPEAVGRLFRLPGEWLAGAKSVLSFFFPFSEAVRSSNRTGDRPSPLWLHGRIEGQRFLAEFARQLASKLTEAGYCAVVPVLSPDFGVAAVDESLQFTSAWSERHVAYISGLGTFGLSRGLITERGMAGRLISLVTTLSLEPTPRNYTEIYQYCIRCGACVRRCPAKAISLEHGKDNLPCAGYVQSMGKIYSPRYGCGKCQTAVPCEFSNPSAR